MRPLILALTLTAMPGIATGQTSERPRARELGITVGIFPPGAHNAITDVADVRVGHTTVSDGISVQTGVTAILPHGGNPYLSRVPAAIHVGNGFGKLLGVTQVRELGEMETPILLTCTLCVWKAADAMVTGVPTFQLGAWPLGGIQTDETMLAILGKWARRQRSV